MPGLQLKLEVALMHAVSIAKLFSPLRLCLRHSEHEKRWARFPATSSKQEVSSNMSRWKLRCLAHWLVMVQACSHTINLTSRRTCHVPPTKADPDPGTGSCQADGRFEDIEEQCVAGSLSCCYAAIISMLSMRTDADREPIWAKSSTNAESKDQAHSCRMLHESVSFVGHARARC